MKMKGEKAICAVCKNEFIKKSKDARTCSHSCYMTLWREEHRVVLTKVCATCGEEFETSNSVTKYCSDECRRKARRKTSREYARTVVYPPRSCEECGKEFTPRAKNSRFCCTECSVQYHKRKHLKGGLAPKKCAVCGKEFTPNSASAKYCSDDCRKRAQQMKGTKPFAEENTEVIPQKRMAGLNAAARRWAKMSWTEVTLENEYYGFSYKESQIRAYAGTLPEDYGLKRKKALKYETR